jgi:GntR family transcriptional repressor for pyruvate dehydrogenase complex
MILMAGSKQRLPEAMADHLQSDIVTGQFPVGHRLPTELELAKRYDVSRTVVREAARLLVQRGVVTVRPGRGMAVAKFDGQFIAEQYALLMGASAGTFDQLLGLRLVLEVEMSALAAMHPRVDVLAEMQATITRGEVSTSSRLDFLESDLAFHELLAQASGNPFFNLVALPINEFLKRTYRDRQSYPSDPKSTLAEHRDIVAAIGAGDSARARVATEGHLRRLLHNRERMLFMAEKQVADAANA